MQHEPYAAMCLTCRDVHCTCGTNAAQVVLGVKQLSARSVDAANDIHAMLPNQIDMEEFMAIVGNLCLCLGVTGPDMVIFARGLKEFVDIMHDQQKQERKANG